MKKKIPKISEAEWQVMKVVWDNPSASAAQIIEKLAARQKWSNRTIKTLLARLVNKGALTYTAEANRYLYEPNIPKEELIKQESQSFMNRVFDGGAVPMLAHFVKHAQFSSEEIHELKQILEEKTGESGNGKSSRKR